MDIRQEALDGSTVVQVDGRIDASTAGDFESTLKGIIGETSDAVVLDLARVHYMSSAGLRVLLVALREMAGRKRKFALAAVNADVMDVVRLTGFDRLLTCYDDVPAAVAGVAG